MNDSLKARYIKTAGILALLGNTFLALFKIFSAFVTGSMAVMGDGLDSATDVLIALVTLFVGSIVSRPSDKTHPWGHARSETTATMILSLVIFCAGAQLVLQSSKKIISGQFAPSLEKIAIITTSISIFGKTLLAISQAHFAKIAQSELVKANALNMRNDIVLSLSVLVGLFLSNVFKLPILDPIIAFLVGLWIIKNAITLFLQVNTELMDGNTDNSLYKKLFSAALSVPNVKNPHRARIRRLGSLLDIDLDIEVPPSLTIYDAHELAEQVEEAIRKEIPEVYDIVIHLEPYDSDSHQRIERYGLTPSTFDLA